jgi:hypothetical protein
MARSGASTTSHVSGGFGRATLLPVDAVEGESVLQVGCIGQASSKSIDRLANHDVELPPDCGGPQGLEPWPMTAGSALRGVRTGLGMAPALGFDVPAANLDLIGDRCLSLQIGGVAGIDDGADHGRRFFAVCCLTSARTA